MCWGLALVSATGTVAQPGGATTATWRVAVLVGTPSRLDIETRHELAPGVEVGYRAPTPLGGPGTVEVRGYVSRYPDEAIVATGPVDGGEAWYRTGFTVAGATLGLATPARSGQRWLHRGALTLSATVDDESEPRRVGFSAVEYDAGARVSEAGAQAEVVSYYQAGSPCDRFRVTPGVGVYTTFRVLYADPTEYVEDGFGRVSTSHRIRSTGVVLAVPVAVRIGEGVRVMVAPAVRLGVTDLTSLGPGAAVLALGASF